MVTRLSNYEKIARALEYLRRGLLPLINSRLPLRDRANWLIRSVGGTRDLDVKDCLEILNKFWEERFRSPQLSRGARGWVNELIDIRNRNAHPTSVDDISNEDTWRALDTAERLLAALGSVEAKNVQALRVGPRDEPVAPNLSDVPPQRRTTPRDINATAPAKSFIESIYVPDLLGGLTIVASARGVRSVRFGQGEHKPGPMVLKVENQLREYADGKRTSFDLAWDVDGTAFQRQVWHALAEIPYGETCSYADIARAIQKPRGAQAVGQANSRNPLLIVIPCHRVINANGSLGAGGRERTRSSVSSIWNGNSLTRLATGSPVSAGDQKTSG